MDVAALDARGCEMKQCYCTSFSTSARPYPLELQELREDIRRATDQYRGAENVKQYYADEARLKARRIASRVMRGLPVRMYEPEENEMYESYLGRTP